MSSRPPGLSMENIPVQSGALQLGRQVVHHETADHHVESVVRERECLDRSDLVVNGEPCPFRFALCHGDHLRSRVDAEYLPVRTEAPANDHGNGAGAAPT